MWSVATFWCHTSDIPGWALDQPLKRYRYGTTQLIIQAVLKSRKNQTSVNRSSSSHDFHIWRDLVLIAVSVVVFFMLSAHLELSERIANFVQNYERWQVDELPLTLLVLSLCFAWFAFRRAREALAALTERIRAQEQVNELLAHNRELSQRLILVQENERRALARELHDEVGQNCTAIRAEASFILHSPVTDSVATSAQRIALAAEALHALVRDMLRRLRPIALDSLGLESALQELCETWEEQTGIACGFFPSDVPACLQDSTAIAIFRLVQEALTNVTRHAGATQVRITLLPVATPAGTPVRLALTIQDDGRGMTRHDERHAGFGLIGMRERVAALQGNIGFFSEAGCGLRIVVELPAQMSVSES